MPTAIASRIKSARLMRGWSLQDVADALNGQLSAQTISRYERGVIEPELEKLRLLSRAFDLDLDYFERPGLELGQLSFRKTTALPKKEEYRILEMARDFLERYLEAESLLNEVRELANPLGDKVITSLAEAEAAAELLREEWNLGDNPIHSIIETLEEQGIKVLAFSADDAFNGLSPSPGYAHPFLVINTDHAPDRMRFTLLHELGHLLLNIQHEQPEKIVNRFAGAMLLPGGRAKRELGEHRKQLHFRELLVIKEEYGISAAAIVYRARDLGIITDYVFQQSMMMINQLGWRKKEPDVFCGKERPRRLLQLVCRGIAEDIISSSKAAQLYGMKLGQFRRELLIFEET